MTSKLLQEDTNPDPLALHPAPHYYHDGPGLQDPVQPVPGAQVKAVSVRRAEEDKDYGSASKVND